MTSSKIVVPGTARTKFECRPGFQDHIFKDVHGVKLPVRIWPANKPKGDKTPWFLWIHGGGWQSGNPYAIDPPMQAGFGDAFHIVSVAYRYIPQVGLKEMVEDCTDAFDWCRARLPTLLPDIDIDSYFVGGDSAGGTLASLMGHHLSPRPKVVLNVYGVMDFTDFRVDNARGIKSDPANGKGDEYEQLLQSRLADRDPAHAQFARASRWLLTLPLSTARAFWGLPDLEFDQKEAVIECDAYDYTSKHHLRFDLLFRKDECPDDKTWSDRLIQYSSLHLLDQEKGYPPTFILHGTGDSIVPVSQGYNFEKKLKEIGVEVATSYPEGEEHAFDQRFNGPEDEGWDEVIVPMIKFVTKHFDM